MSEWALIADQTWRLVACTILLAIAITEYREGKTILPAWCVAVALLVAAGVMTR